MFLEHYIRRTRRNLAALWLFGAALVVPLDGQQSLASDVADFDPVCNVRGSSAKLAFLIGNSDYGIDSGRDALANPAKDIASLCSSFADLDYSVIGVSDVKSSASQSILSLLQREAANVDTVSSIMLVMDLNIPVPIFWSPWMRPLIRAKRFYRLILCRWTSCSRRWAL